MKPAIPPVVVFLLLLLGTSVVFAEPVVAIILDGHQENCTVHANSNTYTCSDRRQLAKGDQVTKLPRARDLKIKWAPFAGPKELSPTTIQVAFDPPETKKGLLDNVKELIGFVKTKHIQTIGATRGGVLPLPGKYATVLPKYAIPFRSSVAPGNSLTIKDSSDKLVLERSFHGAMLVELSPEEIGMMPFETYTWSIAASELARESGRIRLVGNPILSQIISDLNCIDGENSGEPDRTIRKAYYLYLVSLSYPEEVDFHWLSYRLIEKLDRKALNDERETLVLKLISECSNHLREEAP